MDAVIAQLVEQPPCKRQVVGSSPTCGSIFVAPESHNELGTGASQGANGSSPTCGSIFMAPESHNELGTGVSQGANGSSPTCGSTSKNNRECLHSCFVFRVEERCYYTYDFLCKALGLKLKKMGYFG